jgi:protein-L-isoaspartate O-methyltransferase
LQERENTTGLFSGKTKAVSVERLTATIRAAGIRDRRVLEAFGAVRRERFVPAEWAARAYEDVPLPIPHGPTLTGAYFVRLVGEHGFASG